MDEIIALKCNSCGSKLEIYTDMETFCCGHCGTEHIVKRRGGTVSLHLAEAVKKIQVNTNKTAAELAIPRLEKELALLKSNLNQMIAQNEVNRSTAKSTTELSTASIGCIAFILFFCGIPYLLPGTQSGGITFGRILIIIVVVIASTALFLWALDLNKQSKGKKFQDDPRIGTVSLQIQETERQLEENYKIVRDQ